MTFKETFLSILQFAYELFLVTVLCGLAIIAGCGVILGIGWTCIKLSQP